MMAMSLFVIGGVPPTGNAADAFSVDAECAVGAIASCGTPPASIAALEKYCVHGANKEN